jgi:hypothetical protein
MCVQPVGMSHSYSSGFLEAPRTAVCALLLLLLQQQQQQQRCEQGPTCLDWAIAKHCRVLEKLKLAAQELPVIDLD